MPLVNINPGECQRLTWIAYFCSNCEFIYHYVSLHEVFIAKHCHPVLHFQCN